MIVKVFYIFAVFVARVLVIKNCYKMHLRSPQNENANMKVLNFAKHIITEYNKK